MNDQRKLAVGSALMFFVLIAVLLTVLYFPESPQDKITPSVPPHHHSAHPHHQNVHPHHAEPDPKVETTTQDWSLGYLALFMEDLGAIILVALALFCIVMALACAACSCCFFKRAEHV